MKHGCRLLKTILGLTAFSLMASTPARAALIERQSSADFDLQFTGSQNVFQSRTLWINYGGLAAEDYLLTVSGDQYVRKTDTFAFEVTNRK